MRITLMIAFAIGSLGVKEKIHQSTHSPKLPAAKASKRKYKEVIGKNV
jgi:hypothetical protein